MRKVLLLSGLPGSGKTTIVRKALAEARIDAGGFYTEEIREGGRRQGFRLVTLDGRSCVLAHVDIPGPHRVGRYGVSLEDLDRIGVSAIREATQSKGLVVIDEIGKMELFSPRFQEAVLQAVNGDKRVLGTIMLKPHAFADIIKGLRGVTLLTVTSENRRGVFEEVTGWLRLK